MRLNAPTQLFFIISLVLAILSLLGALGIIGAVAAYATWLGLAAWIVLAVGCLMKGA